MRKRVFFCGMLCVTAGILLRVRQAGVWLFPLGTLLLVVALPRRREAGTALFLIICLLCGFWRADALYRVETDELPDCTLTGTVEYVTDTGAVVENARLVTADKTVFSEHVTVYAGNAGALTPGQTVLAEGRGVPYAFKAENPGERDGYLTAMANKQYYVVYADSVEVTGYFAGMASFRHGFRAGVDGILSRHIKNDYAKGILYAMITGDRSTLDPYVTEAFSATGISHLLAVSGLHVSIVLIAVVYLLKLVRLKRILQLIPLTLFLGLYSVLTDFSAPILRASFMTLAAVLAEGTGQRYDPLNGLGAAGICLLCISPYQLFDASFLLSFAASFGIICFSRKSLYRGFAGYTQEALSVSAGATLSTMPVGLYYFGSVSLISLPVNLIAVPVATLAMFLAVAGVLLCLLWNGFGVLLKAAEGLTVGVVSVAGFLSRIPGLTVSFVDGRIIPVGLALAGTFSRLFYGKRLLRYSCAFVLILCMILCFSDAGTQEDGYLRLLSFSYGGKCVHVHCGEHYFVGMNRQYPARVAAYAGRYAPYTVGTFLLCTEDVIGYLNAYGAGFRSKYVYVSDTVPVSVRSALAFYGNVITLHQGDAVEMPEGIFIVDRGGLILQWGAFRIWIEENGGRITPEDPYHLAVTDKNVAAACQFGVYVRDTSSVRYATKQYGCVTAYFENQRITVKPFDEGSA